MSILLNMPRPVLDSKSNSGRSLPAIPELIDHIGLGLSQLYVCALCGGWSLANGAEMILVSAVMHAVSDDFGLSAHRRGMAVSVLFLGVLIGNFLGGPFGDIIGRKPPIIVSFASNFAFSVLSSYALGFFGLCFARVLLGIAFGIGQPSAHSLLSEVTPSSWRIFMVTLSSCAFVVGQVYSCCLMMMDDPLMHDLDWRRLTRLGALPAVVMGCIAALFLIESPSFLSTQGRNQEARDVLKQIRDANGSLHDVDFQPPHEMAGDDQSLSIRFEVVFGCHLKATTWILVYSCFMLNFIYYGSLYAFPQVLPDLESQGTPAMQLLIGALWELPGSFLGIWVGMRMDRKPSIKCYLFAVAMSFALFIAGARTQSSGGATALQRCALLAGFYGVKAFSCAGFAVVYMYVAEVFPTPARVTGTAVCLSVGRVAGIVTPLVYEDLLVRTGGFATFFAVTMMLCLVNYFLVDLLPYETFGMQLKDRVEELGGIGPSVEKEYGSASVA